MKLFDGGLAPNPYTVRLFIAERGGLNLDVEKVDLLDLQNRREPYLSVNPRGEVPALVLDDGRVLTEITAICEYLDEVASGPSLIGATPEERALTRMWTRRLDGEIAQRFIDWWRGSEEAVAFYRGNRVPTTGGRSESRLIADQGLNRLDADLEGRAFLFGDRPGLADVLLFAFMVTMKDVVPWLNPPGRHNVAAWFERMAARPAATRAQAQVARIER